MQVRILKLFAQHDTWRFFPKIETLQYGQIQEKKSLLIAMLFDKI